jgi:hypothetical protein
VVVSNARHVHGLIVVVVVLTRFVYFKLPKSNIPECLQPGGPL